MISRVLVANRGEIARRVFASCRRLGIETVAVHSDADAGLPFVAEADVAVRLPGNAPSETYLRGELIIEAARRTGADAIHPGYGFLSENAEFARAVEAAGLVWIGPAPESIDAMGSKIEAKRIMKDAGVPILEETGDFPVLIKASAGGGGRGMRIVRRAEDLETERAIAEAEALSAFGDGTVFVEPYVERSRHVEVQVVGDGYGDVLVLGERDCTVQRRHQKVIEEAPAASVPADVAAALHDAARKAAASIKYRGAGTVEFLYDPDTERFFFLEMNTRLQVEHPVTELVHGVDLVELQLAVAEGRGFGTPAVEEVAQRPSRNPGPVDGHAIEVRLYAEDSSWTPQSGRLVTLDIPSDAQFGPLARAGIRVDSGFESGSEVGTHYDAMLAKVISWAPYRQQAIRQLVTALRRARIHGVVTNRDHLIDILLAPDFAADQVTTSWLESRPISAESSEDSGQRGRTDVIAGALMLAAGDAARRTVQQGVPAGWRNVTSQPQRTIFEGHEPVEWWGTRDGFVVDGVVVLDVSPTHARLEVDGVATETRGHNSPTTPGSPRELWVDGPAWSACLREVPRFTDPADAIPSGSLLAPMPGTVVKVAVAEGDEVEAGDVVLVLEAMKMQHTITAPSAGRVATLNVQSGIQVAAGEVLAVVEGDDA
jgi:acyl-CoA carboxylase subunit alpha